MIVDSGTARNAPRCLAVIPSRYPSTRLPAKPLKDIHGKTLLERVYRQARSAQCFSEVVIATDDQRIYDAAYAFDAPVLMTSDRHLTGTDRVAEVTDILRAQGKSFDLVANVQGDLPFINPRVIEKTVAALWAADSSFGMSTVVTPIVDRAIFERPACVKALLGPAGRVLYFSRAAIPFPREEPQDISATVPWGYKHMGLYVFRPETLTRMQKLQPTLPEIREKLEQLRLLCNGVGIIAAICSADEVHPSIEVDTQEDLDAAIQYAREGSR